MEKVKHKQVKYADVKFKSEILEKIMLIEK